MERIYFLPEWYLERKRVKKRKMMKYCVSVLIIINLVFLDMLILKLSRIKLLDNDINEKIILEKGLYSNKKNENSKSNKTLNTFYILIKNIPIDINFKSIAIEDGAVNIEIDSKSANYINFANELEKKNQFILKSLVNSGDQESKSFKANLELK